MNELEIAIIKPGKTPHRLVSTRKAALIDLAPNRYESLSQVSWPPWAPVEVYKL